MKISANEAQAIGQFFQSKKFNSLKDWNELKGLVPTAPSYKMALRWAANPEVCQLLREACGEVTLTTTADQWRRMYDCELTDGVKTVFYSY
jgi:hypothetical protein